LYSSYLSIVNDISPTFKDVPPYWMTHHLYFVLICGPNCLKSTQFCQCAISNFDGQTKGPLSNTVLWVGPTWLWK
jgi:hypothetical protein